MGCAIQSDPKEAEIGLAALGKLRDILSQSMLAQSYKTLFRESLKVFGQLIKYRDVAFTNVKNLSCKLIPSAKYRDGWVCDLLDVRSMLRCDKLVLMHKILDGQCPEK